MLKINYIHCPFCNTKKAVARLNFWSGMWYVECHNPDCEKEQVQIFRTESEAVEHWNKGEFIRGVDDVRLY